LVTNIAEGCGRESNLEFKRFLIIAYGSSNELDYQLLLARDLHYLVTDKYQLLHSKLNEVQKMLGSLIKKIKEND
jgi:four helix bundle protein